MSRYEERGFIPGVAEDEAVVLRASCTGKGAGGGGGNGNVPLGFEAKAFDGLGVVEVGIVGAWRRRLRILSL